MSASCVLVTTAILAAASASSAPAPQLIGQQQHAGKRTLLFSFANSVNGGLVGAIGPSMATFQENTGLGDADLGRTVLINRLSKLAGTFLWTAYARRLARQPDATVSPRLALAACMLAAAACAFSIASPSLRSSPVALQAALALFGVAYGFTDPGFTLLTLWGLHGAARESRTHVGYLNAGYTLGALVTPAIVALSLSLPHGDCYACFVVLGIVSALASLGLLLSPVASRAAVQPPPLTSASSSHKSASASTPAKPSAPGAVASSSSAEPRRAGLIVGCMATVLACVTGCEHGVATWLPTFGARVGGVPAQTAALVSSAYWGAICLGRIIWAAVSHAVPSGFAVLTADALTMLIAPIAFAVFAALSATHHGVGATWLLWGGALAMAAGFASSLPCAITLPAEVHVVIRPQRLLAMNLAGSAGEMLVPFLLGVAFERGRYDAFPASLAVLSVGVLGATAIAQCAAAVG